jgi:hypothetical protein
MQYTARNRSATAIVPDKMREVAEKNENVASA